MRVTSVRHWAACFHSYNAIYIRIETDDGFWGEAEVGLKRRTRSLSAVLDELGEYLVGKDPRQIELHTEHMYRRAFFTGPLLLTAISGFDQALWDLKGRVLGAPVYELLGGRYHAAVPVYVHAQLGATPSDLVNEIAAWRARGFDAVKIALPGFYSPQYVTARSGDEQQRLIPPDQNESQVLPHAFWRLLENYLGAATEALGPDGQLLIDCSGRLNVVNALRLCDIAYEHGVLFVEEPVSYERVDQLREVATRSRVQIAAGERWGNHLTSAPFIEQHAASVAQPDVGICGGITVARKICSLAEAHGMAISFHNPFGPLQTAATMHVAVSIPNLMFVETVLEEERHSCWSKYSVDPPDVREGQCRLSDKAGIGTSLNLDTIVNAEVDLSLDGAGR